MYESCDPAEFAGSRAALETGGFDPDATERDHPSYSERAASDASWNPAYLTPSSQRRRRFESEAVLDELRHRLRGVSRALRAGGAGADRLGEHCADGREPKERCMSPWARIDDGFHAHPKVHATSASPPPACSSARSPTAPTTSPTAGSTRRSSAPTRTATPAARRSASSSTAACSSRSTAGLPRSTTSSTSTRRAPTWRPSARSSGGRRRASAAVLGSRRCRGPMPRCPPETPPQGSPGWGGVYQQRTD
jgi:hypothetical protein